MLKYESEVKIIVTIDPVTTSVKNIVFIKSMAARIPGLFLFQAVGHLCEGRGEAIPGKRIRFQTSYIPYTYPRQIFRLEC